MWLERCGKWRTRSEPRCEHDHETRDTSTSTRHETRVVDGSRFREWPEHGGDAEEELASFLEGALPLVEQEPQTTTWFAVRFGGSRFAIFDTFPDDALPA